MSSTEIQIPHDGRSIHSSDPLVTWEVGGRYREMLLSNKDLFSDHPIFLANPSLYQNRRTTHRYKRLYRITRPTGVRILDRPFGQVSSVRVRGMGSEGDVLKTSLRGDLGKGRAVYGEPSAFVVHTQDLHVFGFGQGVAQRISKPALVA